MFIREFFQFLKTKGTKSFSLKMTQNHGYENMKNGLMSSDGHKNDKNRLMSVGDCY